MPDNIDNVAEADTQPYVFEELIDIEEREALGELDRERLLETPPYPLGQFLNRLEVDEMRQILRMIPMDSAAEAVAEMDSESAARLLEAMRDTRAVQLLEELDPDDSADIFGEMEYPDRERLLRLVDPETARMLRKLIAYEPESAGGIMNPQVATVLSEMTVIQTVRLVQKLSDKIEHIHYIYVTDKEHRLLGVVTMRDLVFAKPERKVGDIMLPEPASVPVSMDQEEVALFMAETNLNSLPVVDNSGRLVGNITHDDILDVVRDEATEDIQMMVGAGKDEGLGDSVSESVKRRLPWLLVNLLTAGMAGAVIAVFQEQIEAITALAVCMPVVANLGGNTGAQTLAIVIRSIALNELQTSEVRGILIREGLKGLLNGLAIGVAAGLIVYVWNGSLGIAVVVFAAMILSMCYAGAAGALIPILMQKLNQDPAQGSSIFVTATTDIFGFAVFLGIGTWLLF